MFAAGRAIVLDHTMSNKAATPGDGTGSSLSRACSNSSLDQPCSCCCCILLCGHCQSSWFCTTFDLITLDVFHDEASRPLSLDFGLVSVSLLVTKSRVFA